MPVSYIRRYFVICRLLLPSETMRAKERITSIIITTQIQRIICNLGATNSGSDYYFSYGDVLYIVLNSNNRNAAEHSKLMEKAIKSAPNAKWKVVAFHHDIDVCLTGHDHSYART